MSSLCPVVPMTIDFYSVNSIVLYFARPQCLHCVPLSRSLLSSTVLILWCYISRGRNVFTVSRCPDDYRVVAGRHGLVHRKGESITHAAAEASYAHVRLRSHVFCPH